MRNFFSCPHSRKTFDEIIKDIIGAWMVLWMNSGEKRRQAIPRVSIRYSFAISLQRHLSCLSFYRCNTAQSSSEIRKPVVVRLFGVRSRFLFGFSCFFIVSSKHWQNGLEARVKSSYLKRLLSQGHFASVWVYSITFWSYSNKL